jgi:hypothetical protein
MLRQGYTPDDLRRLYGPSGPYWIDDWRGKRGETPNERTIRETILALARGQTAPAPSTYRIVQ